jgi:hypothetical protein
MGPPANAKARQGILENLNVYINKIRKDQQKTNESSAPAAKMIMVPS